MSADRLLVTREGSVTTITFHRPDRKNAVDVETMRRFRSVIDEVSHDDSRVVVLTGAGSDFCSGADLKAGIQPGHDVTKFLRETTNPAILAMRTSPKPFIAKVRGVAAGIGCNYALACDLIIAERGAQFGQIFPRIGLMPDGGSTWFLPHAIGHARAFEWIAFGQIYDADRCHGLGIVNQVVEPHQLDEAVAQCAARLAAGPGLAYAGIKQALHAASLATALDAEAVNQQACLNSEDFQEGVRAFLEKRKPDFKGR